MEREPEIPRDLKIVAYLCLIFGILAVIDVLFDLLQSHLNLNFGVLQVPIGFGLLRLRRGWRTCALVFLWMGMILVPVFCLGVAAMPGMPVYKFFGQPIGAGSKLPALILAIGLFILMVWEYRVLTRESVRRLFYLGSREETIAEYLARGRQR